MIPFSIINSLVHRSSDMEHYKVTTVVTTNLIDYDLIKNQSIYRQVSSKYSLRRANNFMYFRLRMCFLYVDYFVGKAIAIKMVVLREYIYFKVILILNQSMVITIPSAFLSFSFGALETQNCSGSFQNFFIVFGLVIATLASLSFQIENEVVSFRMNHEVYLYWVKAYQISAKTPHLQVIHFS